MAWFDKYNQIVWDEFASRFDYGHPCRGILHHPAKEAAAIIAKNHRAVGLSKSRADAIRSMILNCKENNNA